MVRRRKKTRPSPWHAVAWGRLTGYTNSWEGAKNLVEGFPSKTHLGVLSESEAIEFLCQNDHQRPMRFITGQRALEVDPTLKRPETYEDRCRFLEQQSRSAVEDLMADVDASFGTKQGIFDAPYPATESGSTAPIGLDSLQPKKAEHPARMSFKFTPSEYSQHESIPSSQSTSLSDSMSTIDRAFTPLSSPSRRPWSEVDDGEQHHPPQKKARRELSPPTPARLSDTMPFHETYKYSEGDMDKCLEQIMKILRLSSTIELTTFGIKRLDNGPQCPIPFMKNRVTLVEAAATRLRVEGLFRSYSSVTVIISGKR